MHVTLLSIMAQHRYRQNKIKREHTIIPGILPALEQLAAHPAVQSITPGRISRRSGNDALGLTVQYKTETGLKLMARAPGVVQEVFVVSDEPQQVQAALEAPQTSRKDPRSSRPARRPARPGEKPRSKERPNRSSQSGGSTAPALPSWQQLLDQHRHLLELERSLTQSDRDASPK